MKQLTELFNKALLPAFQELKKIRAIPPNVYMMLKSSENITKGIVEQIRKHILTDGTINVP